MRPIRIVLADDHALMRAGIRTLLGEIDGAEVVAEACDGREALELVGRHRPDALMVDIAMPGLNGLQVAERVTAEFPGVTVMILTMHGDEEYVRRAVQAGAKGYLLKDSDEHELALAVEAIARGEAYLCPKASKHLLTDYMKQRAAAPGPAAELTPRQREVLRLIARGETTKSIARRLGISAKTVEAHRAQLMDRLDIRDLAGLVRYALRTGLISPED